MRRSVCRRGASDGIVSGWPVSARSPHRYAVVSTPLSSRSSSTFSFGGVPAVGRDGDAEEEHGGAEDVLEVGGRSRAALAGEADRLAEGAAHGAGDGLQGGVVQRGQAGAGGGAEGDLVPDARRAAGSATQARTASWTSVGVLAGDQPEARASPWAEDGMIVLLPGPW